MPKFTKEDVRRVLTWLDEKPTVGNFKKYDPIIDWKTTARSVERPIRLALCHIICQNGKICKIEGRPVVVLEEIAAQSEPEATETLRQRSKQFVKWWLEGEAFSQEKHPLMDSQVKEIEQ